MAKRASSPGRALIIFGLVVLAMYVGLIANGVWKPNLGLDLQGGTRITLTASTETGEAVTQDKMTEAVGIIDSRVNASGVAESEVTKQGDNNIVVEIPGSNRKDLVDTVQQQAQLRFRLVAGSPQPGIPNTLPFPTDGSAAGSGGSDLPPADDGSDKAGKDGTRKDGTKKDGTKNGKKGGAGANGRAVSQGLLLADGKGGGKADKGNDQASDDPQPTATAQPSGAPSDAPSSDPSPAPSPSASEPAAVPTNKSSVQEMLAWARSPDAEWTGKLQAFTCGQADDVADDPSKPLLACDSDGQKYLLSPAIIEGTQLNDASYGIPQNQGQYVVDLDFNGDATTTFAEVTRAINGTEEQFAIVLDAEVLSAPVVTSPITDGNAQITGNFTASTAKSLANSLKYGALPLKFELQEVAEEGPTLAADQLDAGLLAGGLGLALVLVYCLLYYRGLGLVVVASLAIAAAITYAAVIFLSETAGFTLTLPGIAGLIVAVGITADSFIVYFERIRDELRDGKSLRVAVEAGWVRARATCLAADAVSLLAAVVLYIFAIGVVKGFAFALGVSTVIDLVVFFWFTKPMVTWLAKFPFFSRGHRLSGLSPDHVGVERLAAPRPTRPTPTRRPAGGLTR